MDRRRYVPRTDGLEDRQLLSTTPAVPVASAVSPTNPVGTGTNGVQVDEGAVTPETIEAKRRHINNLPYFIGLLSKDGVVPQPTVQNIQNDLDSLVARLNQSYSTTLSSFNLDIRKADNYEQIRPSDNANLNRDFGAALIDAGAPVPVVVDLQKQMNLLVDYDTNQPSSTIAATYDYATVLQLALESGRPLTYPNVPSLLGTDHNGSVGKVGITNNHRPSLTGSYAIGTNIQIVDNNNNLVLGEGAVNPNTGTYTVKFNEALPDGTYTVRVRAEDSGFFSAPSPKFIFKVVTPASALK